MRYLNYTQYLNIGGVLEENSFERIIDRACGIVDFYTYNRLKSVSKISNPAQACVRDICEYLNESHSVNGRVTSESQSAGGISESKSYATLTSDEVNSGVWNIVKDYLFCETDDKGTPLLYKGVRI